MPPARELATSLAFWNTAGDTVRRTSLYPKATITTGSESNGYKLADRHRLNRSSPKADPGNDPMNSNSTDDQLLLGQSEFDKFRELPKEVGVMLITAGIAGLVLPGPGLPALIAGGFALWPRAFGKLESWLEQHHPVVHRQSMRQIDRFLSDLEKRYPYSSRD
jgi:hypothetical protein